MKSILKIFKLAVPCLSCLAHVTFAIENTSSIQVIDATQIVVANQYSDSVSFIDLGSTPELVSEISVGLAPKPWRLTGIGSEYGL